MSESYPLPTEPEGIVATRLERFNSGKVAAMMSLCWRPRRAMFSLPTISPRSCWTGQSMAQVPTASTCTSEARQAISCAAARMASGGT